MTSHKHDLAIQSYKAKNTLLLFAQGSRVTGTVMKNGNAIAHAIAIAPSNQRAAEEILQQLQSEKISIPKDCIVITAEARSSSLDVVITAEQDKKMAERSILFASADIVSGLFEFNDPLLAHIIEDQLKPEEFIELTEDIPTLAPVEQVRSFLHQQSSVEKPYKPSKARAITEVSTSFIPLQHKQALVSYLPNSSRSNWQEFAKKHKLTLRGIMAEQNAQMLTQKNGTIAFADAHNASITQWKDGAIEQYEEYNRVSAQLPALWLTRVQTLQENNLDQKLKIILSKTDAHLLQQEEIKTPAKRFQQAHLDQLAKEILQQLKFNPSERQLALHRVSEDPLPLLKRSATWIAMGFIFALIAAAATFLPYYLEEKKLKAQLQEIKTKMNVISSDISRKSAERKKIEKLKKEMEALRQTVRTPIAKGGQPIRFPHMIDHKNLLNILEESLTAAPNNTEIVTFSSDWNGNLKLQGNSPTLLQARTFTDKFASLLTQKKLPRHIAEVEENKELDNYTFSIKPHED